MMELNRIYHMDNREGLAKLPEKCANLIIADPPYFEVKGEFDFVWKDFDEYQAFMEEQAQMYKKILADNGTLFVWGYVKHIAYIQVIFDKYFVLENSLVWRKLDSIQYQYYSAESARRFNTHNERLLMYSNEGNDFRPLRDYFKSMQDWTGKTKTEIVELIGQSCDHCFRWGSSQFEIPTEETYNKLIEQLGINNWGGFKTYREIRRPFFNESKLEEVLEFSQEAHVTKGYDHDTKKPETLTRALILTCSRRNDLIVVPFAGSGTECAMAAKEGRRFIGFDLNPDYVEMASKRAKEQTSQIQLF
jgi:DNA modification methylase